jgi:ribosomal protein S8E
MVTFTVDVVDNGESGSSDVFTITLRDNDNNVVYTRTGTLTSGNMQVH